jgi:hypothetical protein
VEAAIAIDDATGVVQVTMANDGAAAEGFHVQVSCASGS